jgi:ribosomal RNA-processing protein 12
MSEDKQVDLLEFELKLQKIRQQINSKLENQKHIALVLSAVEENISSQDNTGSPVAYFVSFLSLLEQAINVENDEIVDQSLAATSSYLLDLTLPFIPKALLKSKFPDILIKLAPAITSSEAEAPLIRSAIGSLETLLVAQDINSWNNTALNISPRRGFGGLLEYSLDPRPKVRKRAQEAVHNILANPPPGPAMEHPASGMAADFVIKSLVDLINTKPNQKTSKEHSAQLIHSLQLVSSITLANTWPTAKIEQLCDILLEVSKTSDQYLVSAAFNGFEGLFNSMTEEIDSDKFLKVLQIIFDLKPSQNDTHLAAPWVAVVAKGVTSYAKVEPVQVLSKIPEVFKILMPFFASESSDIYISASQCFISILTEAIPDHFLLLPNNNDVTPEIYEQMDDTITIISELLSELLNVRYGQATREILEVLGAAFAKFRTRSNPDLLTPLGIVGEWRTSEEFEFKAEAEAVVAAAITEVGPETVLGVLPLNLLDSKKPGRAWLLPLLRDNVRFARLGFFIEELVPLVAEFEKRIESLEKNSVTSKIFQTIVDQIWSLLPHFTDLPSDLQTSFTDEFAQQLASLLYSNPELRVNICHALRLLVESNVTFASGALSEDRLLSQEFTIEQAKSNIEYLSTKSSNLLAVLFNVFSQTVPESRGFVLETIDAYLSISSADDLQATFNKVSVLLKNAFDEEASTPATPQQKGVSKLSVTMMDLVVAMAKYVPESSYNALFSIFTQTVNSSDPLLQKRAYRIISKLIDTPSGTLALKHFASDIENVIIQSTESNNLSARAARLQAISTILQIIPEDHLFFIPSIMSEIILATKDSNEKSRQQAYNVLLEMGKVMAKGGIIHNSKIPGFNPASPDSQASLAEYFTMVSAGLAGGNQHMVSATITAISCIVYEFKEIVETDLLVELASTVNLFLTSNSKEIVRSTIGFVKVATVSLPEDIVRPQLRELLQHLMRWSHEHTGHFKSKIKHIVERLIRRFGFETIEQNFPEEDKKLLTNIRKTKARAKRRQAEEEGESENKTKKHGNAYDDVLYDSESDEESEEEDEDRKKGKKKSTQFILESKDTPLDLLDRQALSHISSSKPTKKSKKSNAAAFEKNGKLHFSEEKDEVDEDPLLFIKDSINAYVDAVKSGPVRGQKNKFKFKRGAKARDEDDGMDDGDDELKKPRERAKGSKGNRVSKPKKFQARKKF